MINETIDQKIKRLKDTLVSLQNHADDIETRRTAGNVSPILDIETLAISKIDQIMKYTLSLGVSFLPDSIYPPLFKQIKNPPLNLSDRTNDDLTVEELILIDRFLPGDLWCQGDLRFLSNEKKETHVKELERQIFFPMYVLAGNHSKKNFARLLFSFPLIFLRYINAA